MTPAQLLIIVCHFLGGIAGWLQHHLWYRWPSILLRSSPCFFCVCWFFPLKSPIISYSSDPTWCCLPTSFWWWCLLLPIFIRDLQALRKTKTTTLVNSGKPKQQHIKHMILIVLHKRNLGFPVQNITGLPVGFWQWSWSANCRGLSQDD